MDYFDTTPPKYRVTNPDDTGNHIATDKINRIENKDNICWSKTLFIRPHIWNKRAHSILFSTVGKVLLLQPYIKVSHSFFLNWNKCLLHYKRKYDLENVCKVLSKHKNQI